MKQKWLNWILHLTGIIHQKKKALIYATMFPSIIIALEIIFLEIFLFFVSVPSYLILGEGFSVSKGMQEKEVVSYKMRRKFFNSILLLLLIVWILKQILVIFFAPMPVISDFNL